MISAIKVLNTVTALGTDVSVGTDGILNIASVATVDAYNVRNVSITAPQAEVSGVITITPTSANSTVYTFYVNGFSKSTGLAKIMNVSFTSAASATATTISTQAKAIINADTDFSVVATGTATIVLTGTTGFPFFTVGGTSAVVDSYSSQTATIFTNLSAANGTVGVAAKGTVALLQNKYAYATSGNALTYSELANLTAGYYYTEVVIDYISSGYSGSGAFKGEISTLQAVVLVKFDTGAANPSTTNYADLLGSYGTVTGLKAGYAVTLSSPATTTAAVTVTSGAITLAGGAVTFATLGSRPGDYIVISSDITSITGITGLTAGFGTLTTAVSAATFKYAAWRPLPL